MISLRPHHGMCIANFIGNGYSEEFVENMKQVIAQLEAAPDQVIELVSTEDVLCRSCPFHQDGCVSMEKVSCLDRDVLAACGILAGSRISWRDYRGMVNKRIVEAGRFGEICGQCEWFSLCDGIMKGRERRV